MDSVRIRLVFDDRNVLSRSQKSEGLKRSWFLIKSEIETISDLAQHLVRTFELENSCPNGLLLYMDGFVLPVFESIRILKDEDVVRVKRKGTMTDVIRTAGEQNFLEDSEMMEKQLVLDGVKILAIEHGNQTNDCVGELNEDKHNGFEDALHLGTLANGRPNMKKRKSSKNLQNTRKKKIRIESPKKSPNVLIATVEDDDHRVSQGYHHRRNLSQKLSQKKEKSSKSKGKLNKTSTAKDDDQAENNAESGTSVERHDEVLENDEDQNTSSLPGCTKKFPSRSARRKKAKRKWLRELAGTQKKEIQKPEEAVYEKPVEHEESDNVEHKESEKDTEAEGELVPIVIRPGHIRFEPLGEGQVVQQTQDLLENFQWSGTTSKKRGQKWGIEKTSGSRSNGYKESRENSIEKQNWGIVRSSATKQNGYEDSREDFIENLSNQNEQNLHDPVDFEKLEPLLSTPKEGDIVAYRLVELSSALCPELTPFRVGKVSVYDSSSNRMLLVPVPGYPVIPEENGDEASPPESDTSLYGEDGSLEIDFSLLVDVRMFNRDGSNPVTVVMDGSKQPLASSKEAKRPYENNVESDAPNAGKSIDVWEELSQTLSEKKTQLLEKTGWTKGESSGRSSWSYRALRSSALGPTITMLRAGNELQT